MQRARADMMCQLSRVMGERAVGRTLYTLYTLYSRAAGGVAFAPVSLCAVGRR